MKTAINRVEHIFLSFSPAGGDSCRREYSVTSLILMFFTFSGVGWLWEVLLHLYMDRMFINRGVLTGPWLPIYGTGCVMILILLKKWRTRPLATFGMTVLICGVMEYFTSCALESLFGVRWWNYSDMLFQIQGRVCLAGLMIFGAGGLAVIYAAAPRLDDLFQKMEARYRTMLCSILTVFFLLDLIRSLLAPNMGFGITSI